MTPLCRRRLFADQMIWEAFLEWLSDPAASVLLSVAHQNDWAVASDGSSSSWEAWGTEEGATLNDCCCCLWWWELCVFLASGLPR